MFHNAIVNMVNKMFMLNSVFGNSSYVPSRLLILIVSTPKYALYWRPRLSTFHANVSAGIQYPLSQLASSRHCNGKLPADTVENKEEAHPHALMCVTLHM